LGELDRFFRSAQSALSRVVQAIGAEGCDHPIADARLEARHLGVALGVPDLEPTLLVLARKVAEDIIVIAGSVIERVDVPGERHALALRNGILDLVDASIELRRGGVYRAATGETELVFEVNRYAKSGRIPLISRLLPL